MFDPVRNQRLDYTHHIIDTLLAQEAQFPLPMSSIHCTSIGYSQRTILECPEKAETTGVSDQQILKQDIGRAVKT